MIRLIYLCRWVNFLLPGAGDGNRIVHVIDSLIEHMFAWLRNFRRSVVHYVYKSLLDNSLDKLIGNIRRFSYDNIIDGLRL